MAEKEHKHKFHLQPPFLMEAMMMVEAAKCLIVGIREKYDTENQYIVFC
jgi:hypothetical protein